MVFRGTIWSLGDNIDTDMIVAGKYLWSIDPSYLAVHCLEAIEQDWAGKISKGDILVAGKNFGFGSSREHAPLALKAAGISCVIAESIASIFFRNAINLGLPAIELEGAINRLREGHVAEVNLKSGRVRNLTTGEIFEIAPIASRVIDILESGGLLSYILRRRTSF